MKARDQLIVAAAVALLAGCAGYGPPSNMRAGMSEAEVVQAMGPPTGR